MNSTGGFATIVAGTLLGFVMGTAEPDIGVYRDYGLAGLALLAFWSLLKDGNKRADADRQSYKESIESILATFRDEIQQEREHCDNKIIAGFVSLEASMKNWRKHDETR